MTAKGIFLLAPAEGFLVLYCKPGKKICSALEPFEYSTLGQLLIAWGKSLPKKRTRFKRFINLPHFSKIYEDS